MLADGMIQRKNANKLLHFPLAIVQPILLVVNWLQLDLAHLMHRPGYVNQLRLMQIRLSVLI